MSRPRPKDPRSPGKVTDDPCGTLKNENTWKDEDDVSHVKRDGGDRGLAEAGQGGLRIGSYVSVWAMWAMYL